MVSGIKDVMFARGFVSGRAKSAAFYRCHVLWDVSDKLYLYHLRPLSQSTALEVNCTADRKI